MLSSACVESKQSRDSGCETSSVACEENALKLGVASSDRYRTAGVSLFFLALLSIGLIFYRDYGIPWDEHHRRISGQVSANYIIKLFSPGTVTRLDSIPKLPTLAKHADGDHGALFEIPAIFLELLLSSWGLEDPSDLAELRHLLVFLVCMSGVYAVFRLAERRFADWRIALLGATFLVLTPRIFAESFYNSKDVVFMAFFAIAINTCIGFTLKPNFKTSIFHAMATAAAIDVRIMGIIIPVATLVILFLKCIRRELAWLPVLRSLSLYLIIAACMIVVFWPYLWASPWHNFITAFNNMSQFRWKKDLLYLGEMHAANNLPWHYIPVWILISTPLFYLFLFVVGVSAILVQFMKRNWRLWCGDEELQDLIFLGLFFGPIVIVVALKATLYDGWRHLYFIYPALILVALRGWLLLFKISPFSFRYVSLQYQRLSRIPFRASFPGCSHWWRNCILGATIAALTFIAVTIVTHHPLQNVYMNSLAGTNVKAKFDIDHWGLSNKQALQYIIAHDPRPLIKIWAGSDTVLKYSLFALKKADRDRLRIARDESSTEYIISNYRRNQTDYGKKDATNRLFYQIEVGGEVILTVWERIQKK